MAVKCTATSPERIRISVTDTGAGLPPEKLAQLFQPFNRLGQEASGEEGTGIGLVVSKRLVELMGGVIGVESSVGAGSVFWVELLLTVGADTRSPERRGRDRRPRPGAAPARGCARLLYVEDNPANLKLVEQLIARRSDLRLLSAVDGNLGVELARAAQPDVILMDINLPGISGIEALKILREDPATAHIPGRGPQRQCDAARHREGPGGRVFPLSHQADQGERVHGRAERGAGVRGNGEGSDRMKPDGIRVDPNE